ncbi:DUF3575 domain-containing protein [Alloprevotella sp. OH1205_COT-284]|uniref:DUF3575 domain-containing protein n=1 Tax=Alloprevotella sp. OH1205_COT-284 TaxID=2491043 RepID=UPI0018F682F7|nr:DUF3575 domain-containing protein [Alloprevotella sp. OH1205_COT-284]
MRKPYLLALLLALLFSMGAYAQNVVVKNNLLYDAALTPNLSLEMSLNRKQTFDLQIGLNPFGGKKDKERFQHLLIQPEWRYWTCERFNGWFIGVHALGGRYNIGNYKFPFDQLKKYRDHRYEGWFVGVGVGAGYQWVLSRRWSLEAELGVGNVYTDYDKYRCGLCGTKMESSHDYYFGLTKAAISLVYVIK